MRYEELVVANDRLLEGLAEFIGYKGPISPWRNPFYQLNRDYPDFFRQGEIDWRDDPIFTPMINSIFFLLHGDLMFHHGYIRKDEASALKIAPTTG